MKCGYEINRSCDTNDGREIRMVTDRLGIRSACRRYARWVAPGFNPVYRNITGKQRWPRIIVRRRNPGASKMEMNPLVSWEAGSLEVRRLGSWEVGRLEGCWLLVGRVRWTLRLR